MLGMRIGAAIAALAFMGSHAWAADDLIAKIKEQKVLRVCQVEYAPINIKDPASGEWSGIHVDMAADLAASLGVKVENIEVTWPTVVQSLTTGKCDLSAAATYVTPNRAELVLFSNPTYYDSETAFVATDSAFKSYDDLNKAGIKFSVAAGTAEETTARNLFPNATVTASTAANTVLTLMDVAAKRADASWYSTWGGLRYLKENPQVKVRPVGDKYYQPSPVAFMIAPGEYHFQQYVNIWLDGFKRDGKQKALEAKYLGVSSSQ
jgi:ABC-type amino acid transport substrate-binding protein